MFLKGFLEPDMYYVSEKYFLSNDPLIFACMCKRDSLFSSVLFSFYVLNLDGNLDIMGVKVLLNEVPWDPSSIHTYVFKKY